MMRPEMCGVADGERFDAGPAVLRLVEPSDCKPTYVGWLRDPLVNQYLETRWSEQSLASVRSFLNAVRADPNSHLFAILERGTDRHVGNIKLGPINPRHGYADVSYFIGERGVWGRGFATAAIAAIARIGFERFGLHRVQAGVYAGNVGSIRALEKVGFRREAALREQLVGPNGREDHLFYGLLKCELSDPVGKDGAGLEMEGNG